MDDLDLNYLREADKNLRDTANEDLAWYDYGLDVLKGVGAGVRDAAEETLQFGRDVGNFAEDSANYVLGSEMDFENNNNRILGEVVMPNNYSWSIYRRPFSVCFWLCYGRCIPKSR